MNKFFILFKKELKQIFTLQLILPLIAIILMFNFIGHAMKADTEKEEKRNGKTQKTLYIAIEKQSKTSNMIKKILSKKYEIVECGNTLKKAIAFLNSKKDADFLLFFPKNIDADMSSFNTLHVSTFKKIQDFSMKGLMKSDWSDNVLSYLNRAISNTIINSNLKTKISPAFIRKPIYSEDHAIVNGHYAKVSSSEIIDFFTKQNSMIPMGMLMIIIIASQLIAVAIATEKEDKTLETLLTMPVSRQSIVLSKMLAASVAALFMSIIYVYSMNNFNKNMMTGLDTDIVIKGGENMLEKLGLSLNFSDYFIIFSIVILSILCALSISAISGALVSNVKSAQLSFIPIMILVLGSFFLTSFIDIHNASTFVKGIVYLDPFSYPFLALQNIFLGKYRILYYGIAYLSTFFLILLYITSYVFSSELILTANFNPLGYLMRKKVRVDTLFLI